MKPALAADYRRRLDMGFAAAKRGTFPPAGPQGFYAIGALAVVLVLLSGCEGAGGAPTPGPGSPEPAPAGATVRGHVVEVVGRSIIEVETLRLRDTGGKTWTFTTEGFIGFSPAHLQEHQLFGQTVLVTYVEKQGRLVAVNAVD